jgi:uncharacterized protein (UPF0332 family)
MNIQELIDKDLIRKGKASQAEIKGSIELSKHFLKRAEGNMKIEFYDVAFLLAYNSMFHTGKALLLKAGYKERSHFALIQVLKLEYKNSKDLVAFLDIFDSYRITRHSIQYTGESSSKLDATEAIKDAENFIGMAESLLKT